MAPEPEPEPEPEPMPAPAPMPAQQPAPVAAPAPTAAPAPAPVAPSGPATPCVMVIDSATTEQMRSIGRFAGSIGVTGVFKRGTLQQAYERTIR